MDTIRVQGRVETVLKVVGLDAACGDIAHGVLFEFGKEGAWVVNLDDLERVVKKARELQRRVVTIRKNGKGDI